MSSKLHFRFMFVWMVSVYILADSTTSEAQELGLASQPLFLGTQIDPNIFFMLDDSGSMDWEILSVDHVYFRDYWGDATRRGVRNDGLILVNANNGSCANSRRNLHYLYDTGVNTDNKYGGCSRAQLEDNVEWEEVDWRIRSSDMNIMYYNPSATYRPWEGFSDASFTSARSNPQVGTDGYNRTRNLTGFQYDVWIDNLGRDATVNGPNSVQNGPNNEVDLWDSHTTYTVNSSSVGIEYLTTTFASVNGKPDCHFGDEDTTPQYRDCFGTSRTTGSVSGLGTDPWGRTVAEVKQNIANWYQYHRRRSFVAKAAISTVVSSNTSFRFGLSLLNRDETLFVQMPGELVEDYVPHNEGLLEDMFEFEWTASGTPLRSGLERVGRYYANELSGKSSPIISACQQNYSVLFTDGYWSNNDNLQTSAIENTDQDGDGSRYSVADVAKYFYDTDLSPLPNDVPTSTIDQNDAQHMVTFTVAFGVEGNLTDSDNNRIPDTDWTGTPGTEVTESSGWHSGDADSDDFNNAEKIDDVWHAAFNSKGYFVSAQSTDGVAEAISDALLEIADRVGSAASVATNTGSLNAGSKLFQARFDSSDWKGQLLAFQINLDGTIEGFPDWEAGSLLNNNDYDTGREIITFNPNVDNPPGGNVEGVGIPFRFPANYTNPVSSTEMTTEQIQYLLTNAPHAISTVSGSEIAENQTFGTDIVNYLRGDDSNEAMGQGFRERNSVLGDIVNSDPNFVDVPNGRYPDDLEAKSYNSFLTDNSSRQGVVYVGANDGMLHGFSDDTGAELIAYIPSAVYKNLDNLASPDYEHKYFVDGGPNIIDVFLDDTSDPGGGGPGVWRTVLAGGLNGGGQQVYALDVTEPASFSEANADDIVMWEFDDSDDVDMGYSYGRPQMAKMADGTWAAVFGNGYNNTEADGNASSTGHAVLFIVDVETGEVLRKIDTNSGSAGTPNGLATPLMVDSNGDSIVDYIYAGDLNGDLWKFDVTDSDKNQWKVAGGASPRPLFSAESGQAITSQPQASFHPDNLGGFMIFVGTGKYLEVNDNDGFGQDTQAFYGIWDKNQASFATLTSAALLEQSITNQFSQAFDTDNNGTNDETFILRDVSDNLIDWDVHDGWRIDLRPDKIENVSNILNYGERQVSNAIVRNGRVIFTTLIPSTVECEFGGTSFLMELDFRDGSALEFPAFDLNGDGEYDGDDTDASGRASDVGIMPTVSILADGAQDVAFGSGASGDIDVIQLSVGTQAFGRQSWRQLE
ncbi:MAG: pilus assembly protein [Pseudohongiellaceae bacterium]